jgi:biotin-(acetyl-CoA carboxylase) ligase
VTEGKAIAIDHNGNLVLERPDHHLETILYGDCFEIPTERSP